MSTALILAPLAGAQACNDELLGGFCPPEKEAAPKSEKTTQPAPQKADAKPRIREQQPASATRMRGAPPAPPSRAPDRVVPDPVALAIAMPQVALGRQSTGAEARPQPEPVLAEAPPPPSTAEPLISARAPIEARSLPPRARPPRRRHPPAAPHARRPPRRCPR